MGQKYKLNSDMIYRKIGEQRMLVPVGQHIDDVRSIYTLNETAAFVLDSLQADLDTEQVASKLIEEYDCPENLEPSEIIEDVINDFKQHNIIL